MRALVEHLKTLLLISPFVGLLWYATTQPSPQKATPTLTPKPYKFQFQFKPSPSPKIEPPAAPPPVESPKPKPALKMEPRSWWNWYLVWKRGGIEQAPPTDVEDLPVDPTWKDVRFADQWTSEEYAWQHEVWKRGYAPEPIIKQRPKVRYVQPYSPPPTYARQPSVSDRLDELQRRMDQDRADRQLQDNLRERRENMQRQLDRLGVPY